MKKKLIVFLLILLTAVFLFSLTANADFGPKPSTYVRFFGVEEECYATLLSNDRDYPMFEAYDGTESSKLESVYEEFPEVWQKMVDYEDEDGYRFLQLIWDVSYGKEKLSWTYYAPEEFKILLYFPASDSFLVTEALYRDVFYCYYYLTVEDGSITSLEEQDTSGYPENQKEVTEADTLEEQTGTEEETRRAVVSKEDPSTGENESRDLSVGETSLFLLMSGFFYIPLISFLISFAITFGAELLIALVFGFRSGKHILCILLTNLCTLSVMTFLIVVSNVPVHGTILSFPYLLFELAVAGAEAGVYVWKFPRYDGNHRSVVKIILYALIANIVTYVLSAFLNPLQYLF